MEFEIFFFIESISIIKEATSVKKEAEKVQSFFFAQIPPAFIQCIELYNIAEVKILSNTTVEEKPINSPLGPAGFGLTITNVRLFICLSVHHKPKPFFILQPLSFILQLLSFSACF